MPGEVRAMEPIVRYALPEELGRINELRAMVSALHAEGRPDIFRPGFCGELRALAEKAMQSPDLDVIAAVLDDEVCGFAVVRYIDRPESAYMCARKIYHIEEFGVDAAFRRRGAATALVGFCRSEAARLGFDRIELDVWSFNYNKDWIFDEIGFYENAGFREFRSFMELQVD